MSMVIFTIQVIYIDTLTVHICLYTCGVTHSQISIDTSAAYLSSMPAAGYVQARNYVYFLCLLWQVLETIFSPISMRHNQVGRSCSSS